MTKRLGDEERLETDSVGADCRAWLLLSGGGDINPSNSVRLNNTAGHIPLLLTAQIFVISKSNNTACISITFFSNSSFETNDLLLTRAL